MKRTAFLAALSAILALAATVNAQTKRDPYTQKPFERESAALPAAFGVIVGGKLPLVHSAPSAEIDTKALLPNVDVFYDTWQLGYHFREYGNMIQLHMRSVGRDVYSSWYIEYGSKSGVATLPLQYNETLGQYISKDTNYSWTPLGLGYHYASGFGRETAFSYLYDMSFGTVSGAEFPVYAVIQAGLGARIPISSVGLTLGFVAYAGLLPSTLVNDDPNGVAGIAANVSIGLNFSK